LRRGVEILAAFSILPVPIERALSAAAASCSDPASESLRASLHYTDAGPNPAQACAACTFFAAPERNQSCGSCTIMSGPVNPKGHCDSWSAKS
jgi:hypothetical protein